MDEPEQTCRAQVDRERPYRPFGVLTRISRYLMTASAKDLENGVEYYGYFAASIILTAFSFEGFLNDLGQQLLGDESEWNHKVRERKKARGRNHELPKSEWMAKVDVITERANVLVNFSDEPWATVRQVFELRNSIAHPTYKLLQSSKEEFGPNEESLRRRRPLTAWEEKCNRNFATHAREQIESVANYLAIVSEKDLLEFV